MFKTRKRLAVAHAAEVAALTEERDEARRYLSTAEVNLKSAYADLGRTRDAQRKLEAALAPLGFISLASCTELAVDTTATMYGPEVRLTAAMSFDGAENLSTAFQAARATS